MKHLFTALVAGSALLFAAQAAENLLANPDFQAKKGWNLWQSGKRTEWPGTGTCADGKIELKNCVNACYSQNIKVQPGEQYTYTVTGINTSKGNAMITIAFLDANRKWIGKRITAKVPASGKEETVSLEVTVPENGANMSVQLGAAKQAKEDTGVITYTKADLQKK